jgi:hypothetical protein
MSELLISRITVAFSLIPIAMAIYRWNHLNKALMLFFMYKVLSLLLNLGEQFFIWYATKYYPSVEPYLTYFGIQDTSFIGILYHVIAFIYLGRFYKTLVGNTAGRIILWVAYLLLSTSVINYCFIEGYRVYGKFNPGASAIFIFGTAVYYLYQMFRSNLSLPVRRNPYFWLSLGVIVPNLLGVFFFLIGDAVHQEDYSLFTALSSFKNGFLIIGQILMGIGFWHAPFAKFVTLPEQK